MSQPFVSVIIPCRNEGASLARCLDSILGSTYPANRMEVIVADGMSDHATRAIVALYAERDKRVRLLDNPEQITPHGLNRAITASRGELIQRVDAHSIIAPDYIARAIANLQTNGAWAVGGNMHTVAEQRGPFADAIQVALSHWFGVGNARFRIDATRPTTQAPSEPHPVDAVFNACWRREVFTRIGLFYPRLKRSQDIELSARIRQAGGTMLLDPRMRTVYFSKAALNLFLRQNWINGVWALLPLGYLRKLPMSLRHLAPLAFVSGLAVLVGAASTGLIPWWLALAAAAPYVAVNFAVSLHVAAVTGKRRLALQLPLVFACLHFGYGAGSVWGALRAIGILITEWRQPAEIFTPHNMPAAMSASASAAGPAMSTPDPLKESHS